MDFTAMSLALRGICAFRPILDQPMLARAIRLLEALNQGQGERALDLYRDQFFALKAQGYAGLGDWLWDWLRDADTPYGHLIAQGEEDFELMRAAHRDVETLIALAGRDCAWYMERMSTCFSWEYATFFDGLPHWSNEVPFTFDSLNEFYQANGCGLYARHRAFLWAGEQPIPVEDPDCLAPEEMVGYDMVRQQVWNNTQILLSGHRANNVLLFGDGGTGKSATVKSMLRYPGSEALRLIEIQKGNLTGLPRLMRTLGTQPQKFILFVDDLVFDQDDSTYSELKTVLEGGLERQPDNVVIYATSNRRHLIRQTFGERGSDEVDVFETIAEKTALAERFGLRLPFMAMDKEAYLSLVDYLLWQSGREPSEELHTQAMEWELRHAGRTPRVARQFLAFLCQEEIQGAGCL